MTETPIRLLVAASGTGGHLFPAIATTEHLSDYEIEWLGVPDRLETQLVPEQYLLHTIPLGGLQGRLGLSTVRRMVQLLRSILQVRQILQQGEFQGVFTTGGYIAAPAIIAARSLGLPSILHESNALPGKVTRWLSPWCSMVALGFEAALPRLSKAKSICVGTPVRAQFLASAETPLEDLEIPSSAPLIVIVGGSQGAVAVNQLVRQCASTWFKAGAWIIHLTGENDPDADSLEHAQYVHMPFYNNMAALLKRANLAISRAGAGTLTELAVTKTPSILIPYPYAAEDHQAYNAAAFAAAGAAQVCRQSELTPEILRDKVLNLLESDDRLQKMAKAAGGLAITDSAERLAELVQRVIEGNP
ncbi:MAG: undecaprenyldiphospho-muramoylpentapeptide beta-N-acetylglucosaminyltransferase [Leptolyngbyaceae cyanobacterium MO_188.B28]|nr:undecaprenyldiphospho-muramoylpentapeptide beta-N-acetylglucosaminyltransferase [Leptolyngbyaceae cyanobacterium MO_188.B28]